MTARLFSADTAWHGALEFTESVVLSFIEPAIHAVHWVFQVTPLSGEVLSCVVNKEFKALIYRRVCMCVGGGGSEKETGGD